MEQCQEGFFQAALPWCSLLVTSILSVTSHRGLTHMLVAEKEITQAADTPPWWHPYHWETSHRCFSSHKKTTLTGSVACCKVLEAAQEPCIFWHPTGHSRLESLHHICPCWFPSGWEGAERWPLISPHQEMLSTLFPLPLAGKKYRLILYFLCSSSWKHNMLLQPALP